MIWSLFRPRRPDAVKKGGDAGVAAGVAAGAGSDAGAVSVAGAGAGVADGGGFTGAVDAGWCAEFTGVAGAVSVPTALRTAAINDSAACGDATDPVRIVLKSTMRP